ncbi:hypothetical protein PIB30_028646 [Stylosanthes scabra]|uniref:Uncharacterized protein n=1 Tax=Stylosanthes scabra TaxID=79078 RepID=A0ABU6QBU3_9FABA|nr:hypothetical protein [Stylosanthes scabra]
MAEDVDAMPPLIVFDACQRAVDIGEAGGSGEAKERAGTEHEGLSSPGFQNLTDQILVPNDGYMLEFDDTQFDVDLKELDSGPSQFFMVLGSTPPFSIYA